jgi:hypothetical protein
VIGTGTNVNINFIYSSSKDTYTIRIPNNKQRENRINVHMARTVTERERDYKEV